MIDLARIPALLRAISQFGADNPAHPRVPQIQPLAGYFTPDGLLDKKALEHLDGESTRREILVRFLLLSAVLDQGPDIAGVRMLLERTLNSLYAKDVRILHNPLDFFANLSMVVDEIALAHESVKQTRSESWATENHSNPARYNLFMDNSHQALSYAVFRWGTPLSLPMLLDPVSGNTAVDRHALTNYVESWDSAEEMSKRLKSHRRYGLGKAVGDKACHLFAKWFVATFKLARKTGPSWGEFSFEVPYDSNAGRVLWRTGYLLAWAATEQYVAQGVVKPGQGKGGTNYLRVTDIRGMSAATPLPNHIHDRYAEVCVEHLRTHKRRPLKAEIQRIQHGYLLSEYSDENLGIAAFDDGLIAIGTRYCFNHEQPMCSQCPINQHCQGYLSRSDLITDYRT